MPPTNSNLNENSIITISKRFIKDKRAKELLLTKFDWNTPGLKFEGRTIARNMTGNHEMYDVILNELPGMTLTFRKGCIKYVGPYNVLPVAVSSSSLVEQEESIELTEDLLEDAIQEPLDE
ncbi:hypothetical protein [Parasitella parasitica]|uniref:Uncharacterized protein n=1 Tax=Parasitella parasitica TaxID=35722 RepID=A0A0B7N1Y2_9FUNG|nr:hypothetical protein [Parasitella parasitica]